MIILATSTAQTGESEYNLLLRGGHVIDVANGIYAARDVAVTDGNFNSPQPP